MEEVSKKKYLKLFSTQRGIGDRDESEVSVLREGSVWKREK